MKHTKRDASPKSPAESLIGKLEELKPFCKSALAEVVLCDAIAIVRKHQAEQPQDVMERVAKAIAEVSDSDNPWQSYRDFAKAAIIAMGDGRATIAPVSAETVQPITPASDDGWIEWHGGNCPLPGNTRVDYEMRDGDKELSTNCSDLRWSHLSWDGDIVRYRVSMGNASTRKDEFSGCSTAGRSNDGESGANASKGVTAGETAKSREIRLIDYDEVMKAGDAALMEYWDKKAGKYSDADLPSRYEWLAIFARISPYLRQSPVDIEAGAIACSQWVYGVNHGAPGWDRLSEEHRNEYREQARATARAWGLIEAGKAPERESGVLTPPPGYVFVKVNNYEERTAKEKWMKVTIRATEYAAAKYRHEDDTYEIPIIATTHIEGQS